MGGLFSMIGGVSGRWLSYRCVHRHPIVYTLSSFTGVALILVKVPVVAPLGALFVMIGDGMIYGTISRFIDSSVPKAFNLTAISFWLVVGDFGSVFGSNLISYIHDW